MPLSDADKDKLYELVALRTKLQKSHKFGGDREGQKELDRIEDEIQALKKKEDLPRRPSSAARGVNSLRMPRRGASPLMGSPTTPPPRGRKDD
jgi:hypothetical protein